MSPFAIKAIQFLASMSLLIILHELGHFIPARLFKIRVEKFFLFFDVKFALFQKKFGEIIDCIPYASEVTKLSALCMVCKDGTPGPFTKRTVEDRTRELIGGSDMYSAVCRKHI